MTDMEKYAIRRLSALVDEANQIFYRGGPKSFPGYSESGSATSEIMARLSEMDQILRAMSE